MKELFSGRRTLMPRLLIGAARALLTAVLAGAQIFGGYAPFAVGAAAAAGGGWEGFAALAGAALGSALLLDFSHGLRLMACCVLLFTANNAFCELRAYRRPFFLPALTAALTLAVEAVYVLRSGSASEAACCLIAAALAALSAHSFRLLRAPGAGREYPAAALTLLLGVLMALAGPQLGNGFAPGRIAATLAVLLLAFERDAAAALTAALCIGLGIDLTAAGQSFLHTACYGFAALMTALLHRDSRLRAASVFALSAAFFALPLRGEEGLVLLYEALCGTLIFLLLPTAALRALHETREPEDAPLPEDGVRRRLKAAAAGLRELYDSVSRAPPVPEENPAVLFDRSAEKVCRDCSLREYCWEREYSRTYTALNDATAALLQNGVGRGEDFPSYFSDRCIRFPSFLAAVNQELSAFLLRRQYRGRLSAAYAREARQYARVSELLDDAAERPAAQSAMAAPALRYRVGSSLRPKAGQKVSGDCAAGFETASGDLCLLLADGMGSGEEARRESALAARLLERFLRSGIDALPALRTLNGALNLRAEMADGFTTVDLLTLSLHSGEAALYKYGAAPSYIKRGEQVYRIGCAGLPAGLAEEGAPPECTHLRLDPGCAFVMVTDGAADSEDDGWLQDLLASWQGEDPQQLAAAILADSAERRGTDDDAGVLTLILSPPDDAAVEI